MLFKEYPIIEYVLNNKPITLVDIFKNIAFTNTETSKAFFEYYIQDGETPEHIAAKFYGDTSLSWLILLPNNISDIQNDWFSDSATHIRKTKKEFGGDALYLSALPDIQEGDIVIKVTATSGNVVTAFDASTYRIIGSFDPMFRVIRGITGFGTFTSNDNVMFARHNPTNGTVSYLSFLNGLIEPETVNFTTLYRIEDYEDTIDYFYNANNVVISPYTIVADPTKSIRYNSVYTYPQNLNTVNNFASTVLYSYISGTLPSNISKRSISKTKFDTYYKKQKIKILKSEYARPVLNAISNLLKNNEVGRIFRIEL